MVDESRPTPDNNTHGLHDKCFERGALRVAGTAAAKDAWRRAHPLRSMFARASKREIRQGSSLGLEIRQGSPLGLEIRQGSSLGLEIRQGSSLGLEICVLILGLENTGKPHTQRHA